jgi:hypothetical protein
MATLRVSALGAAAIATLLVALPGVSSPGRRSIVQAGIGRVRLELVGERIVVTTDVTLPARPGTASALEVHAAYAAPATPLAAEAELLGTPRGFLVAPSAARGSRIDSQHALAAGPASELVLGRARMAGRRIRATAQELELALAPAGLATLRLRELRPLPPPATDRAHQVLVRLGTLGATPLVLGSIELEGSGITRHRAYFCGPDVSAIELWVHPPRGARGKRVAAPLAARRATDDLCIDFWRTP